jgi:plastocyanin
MHRSITAAVAATAALGVCAAGIAPAASAAAKPNQIVIKGNFKFRAGKGVSDNQRFTPRKLKVDSGATVTVKNRSKTEDPHSLSFVEKESMPVDFEPAAAGPLFGLHNLSDDPNAQPVMLIDDGAPAADQTANLAVDTLGTDQGGGDSLLLFGKAPVQFDVTASAGSKLHYFCIFHPWMQGRITVR